MVQSAELIGFGIAWLSADRKRHGQISLWRQMLRVLTANSEPKTESGEVEIGRQGMGCNLGCESERNILGWRVTMIAQVKAKAFDHCANELNAFDFWQTHTP